MDRFYFDIIFMAFSSKSVNNYHSSMSYKCLRSMDPLNYLLSV